MKKTAVFLSLLISSVIVDTLPLKARSIGTEAFLVLRYLDSRSQTTAVESIPVSRYSICRRMMTNFDLKSSINYKMIVTCINTNTGQVESLTWSKGTPDRTN